MTTEKQIWRRARLTRLQTTVTSLDLMKNPKERKKRRTNINWNDKINEYLCDEHE